jgi:hypothetical protein
MFGHSASNPSKQGAQFTSSQAGTMFEQDSSAAEVRSSNEKRTREMVDEAITGEATGVQKAEAVVLAWSKNTVWAIYAWYEFNHQTRYPSTAVKICENNKELYYTGFGFAFLCWPSIPRSG